MKILIPLLLLTLFVTMHSCSNLFEEKQQIPQQEADLKQHTEIKKENVVDQQLQDGQITPYYKQILEEFKTREIPNSKFLKSDLLYALQEDGIGKNLWRMLEFEDKLIYDINSATVYIKAEDGQKDIYGITFPKKIVRNDFGWEDEVGFPYYNVISYDGIRYVSIEEIAEKNNAFVDYPNGYGDVEFYSASLLKLMKDNLDSEAAYYNAAWRHVYFMKHSKSKSIE